ncbi:hypothetical protein [Ideonella sp. BN130291]|uniref:hypothetical protein n=1 Tax=Ideonella sp. BN130291 TaxID=3112940 RepID=UPI002E26363E|nr:hypothetical protein [Ideonella sp. BN130291]
MPRTPAARPLAVATALACAAAAHAEPEAAARAWSGELRAHVDARSANPAGPLAAAARLSPGLVALPRGGATVALGLRAQQRGVSADVLLQQQRLEGGGSDSTARFNELVLSGAWPGSDAWQYSAGRKIVGWDVGYGWRPNDVVQQEQRRTLQSSTPQGRPLLQLEHFSADTAWTLVWVNPQRLNASAERRSGSNESALAGRVYRRDGAVDWHGFARWGEHTHASVGLAAAWVATESLEWHASWRWATAHDGWRYGGPGAAAPATANPWHVATLSAAQLLLVGFTWTNADQWSVLAEAWHDGSAPGNADWRAWQARTESLAAAGTAAPEPWHTAYAANLAWQATPWDAQNLRRDNLFLRLSWQHGAWQPAVDLLLTPTDGGRVLTAALAWQGDRLRLEAGVRAYGGPADALLAQLPLRRTAYLLASHAF